MADQSSRTASPSDTAGTSPFDSAGIERATDGVLHYTDLPANLVAMLRNAVDAAPDAEALVEYGVTGRPADLPRNCGTARRASRVACAPPGSPVATASRSGCRTATTGCSAFFGTLLAGGVVVPVNTRLAEPEVAYVVEDSGARSCSSRGAAARRRTARRRRPGARRAGRDLLHQRDDGVPEGCDDHPRELPVQRRDLHPLPRPAPRTRACGR